MSIFWKKVVLFKESFSTRVTNVTSFAQIQKGFFALERYVTNFLRSVVVDIFCSLSATRTNLRFWLCGEMNSILDELFSILSTKTFAIPSRFVVRFCWNIIEKLLCVICGEFIITDFFYVSFFMLFYKKMLRYFSHTPTFIIEPLFVTNSNSDFQ